ncbi:hypothetical protein V6N13_076237 [Hibiscus sabdariffa]|uniref:Uncharacterized protein n=2 Tax=Hibiscus sabdariffa TaxID=183260 RepID=A0ABR2CTS1_9ROSI
MPPRPETRSGACLPVEDQNVDVGLVHHDGLPFPPPIPPTCRGQSADMVILAVVLVYCPMLGLVLECRCVSGAIGVTIESIGGYWSLYSLWFEIPPEA